VGRKRIVRRRPPRGSDAEPVTTETETTPDQPSLFADEATRIETPKTETHPTEPEAHPTVPELHPTVDERPTPEPSEPPGPPVVPAHTPGAPRPVEIGAVSGEPFRGEGHRRRRRRRPRRGGRRQQTPQPAGNASPNTLQAPTLNETVARVTAGSPVAQDVATAAIENGQAKVPSHSVDWNGREAELAVPLESSVPGPTEPVEIEDTSGAAALSSPAEDRREAAGAPPEKSRRKRSRRRGKGGAAPPGQPGPAAKIGHGHERLISVTPGEECRIALTRDGRLEEIFIERASAESHVGNIYKGRVTNVEPSIQAAFVDFGLNKNGFLHISDIVPQYFPDHNGELEEIGRKTPRRDRPPIQKCLRRGQEVIVQITKEGIGTKGPTLTTYISVPGRFLVMMPGMNRLGVSRRIEEDEDRRKMREILNQLELPKGMGFILRTAGLDRTRRELQQDLNYLMRLWKTVTEKIKNDRAPATLYQESDLAIRTVRDTLEADIERVIIDDQATAQKVRDFLAIAMPNAAEKVQVYSSPEPLFYRYGIESEIDKLHGRHVPLPSGGSLVIDSTEALVAIDVNSGKYREQDDAEETARRINLEAAEEIARQLRLRDLGGVIVCDFIDMRMEKNRREVEKSLREALKRHKERAKILRMSRFGMIEMTRQRTRPSISRSLHQDCPHCQGRGMVKSPETTMLDVMRMLQLAVHRENIHQIEVQVCSEVAFQLQNRKRRAIHELESRTNKTITVRACVGFGLDRVDYVCTDARGQLVKFP